jgi:hypothetical protein
MAALEVIRWRGKMECQIEREDEGISGWYNPKAT